MKTIAVIGLGYVGLPLAELCARKGYKVYGLDIDEEKVKLVNNNGKIKATTSPSILKDSNIIVVCVPTPVDKKKLPDYTAVKAASEEILKNIKQNLEIIIESTINPGCTEEVIKPILEKSGLKAGIDFYLAHCPERINPGDKKWDIINIPRVVGGINKESTERAYEFYTSILESKVTKMSSLKAAEAVKIMENTFRDVNIAFVNELAKSFSKLGIDITEVITGASTKPFGFLPHYPGCGVGGHCIPVDPYYLIENAGKNGFDHEFLRLARKINDSMPKYTVNLLVDALNKMGKCVNDIGVGVLGLAYKGEVGDIRESPSFEIIESLKELGAKVSVYDPYLIEKSTVKSIEEFVEKSECVVLVTDHSQFRDIDYSRFKIVIDGRNFLDKEKLEKQGVIYRGIGR